MFVLGILIGIFEIIIGVITLVTSNGIPLIIGTGIGYILSGFLFLWLCVGAHTAYNNSRTIDYLSKRIKALEDQKNLYFEMFKRVGLSEEDVKLLSETSFDNMSKGHRLVSLIDRQLKDSSLMIPKGGVVTFERLEEKDGETNIIVRVVIGGESHLVRFKPNEVISECLYSKENS